MKAWCARVTRNLRLGDLPVGVELFQYFNHYGFVSLFLLSVSSVPIRFEDRFLCLGQFFFNK